MELNTFIKETLVQIQQGVKEANIAIAHNEGKKVRVNGEMMYTIDQSRGSQKDKDAGISFDIAVTVTSEKTVGGEGRINVVGMSLGGGKNSTSIEQNVSRIKFKVDPFNTIY